MFSDVYDLIVDPRMAEISHHRYINTNIYYQYYTYITMQITSYINTLTAEISHHKSINYKFSRIGNNLMNHIRAVSAF